MYPSNQQQVWGNQHYPFVATGAIGNQNPSNQTLWGGNVRRIMGILQIIFGGIELVIGIAVIFVPGSYFYYIQDYVGYGIWTGVFAGVTGFLGVFSLKTKCMVTAYMVTSIITAVMSAGCCLYAIFGAISGVYSYNRAANLALYIILCITVFAQMVVSIIGASFTCNAVCSTTGQPQQLVYYSPQPMPQQCVPPPQYTANASQSGLAFHNTAPTAHGGHVSAKI